jgi:multiple sugar transport system permease protein
VAKYTSDLRRRQALLGYLFISPWIIGFLALVAGPLLAALVLSFTNYNLLSTPQFIGWQNYTHMFASGTFWTAIRVTFLYAVLSVPIDLLTALILALMLNNPVHFLPVFRTIFYLPALLPPVATSILWLWILNPDYGILNTFLKFVGLPQPQWFLAPQWTVPGYVIMSMWGVGTWMVIFLAGLQNVPQELLESAQLDGAGVLSKFWNITMPMISPVLFFNLVMGIVGAFSYFTQAFVIGLGVGSGTGVANSGLFYALYLYQKGFSELQMGYASALGWVMFLIILLLSLLVFRSSTLWVYYGGETDK